MGNIRDIRKEMISVFICVLSSGRRPTEENRAQWGEMSRQRQGERGEGEKGTFITLHYR